MIRITCPSSKLPKEQRIAEIIKTFDKWLTSNEFVLLMNTFDGYYPPDLSTVEKINWLKSEFTSVWDYRKKQTEAKTKEGEAARWRLKNDTLAESNRELILKTAETLGLIGISESIFDDANYILPLGGGKMSNLRRCELASEEASRIKSSVDVIALSGMRLLSEDEKKEAVYNYAPNAITEYDAICSGMKKSFETVSDEDIKSYTDSNPNLSYAIKQFFTRNEEQYKLYAIAAPSTNPQYRANTADCFKFFFEEFKVPKHSKIVNCTGQIYCTYQQVMSLSFAIDYEVEFDTIGFPFKLNCVNPNEESPAFSEPVNYLQEIKATIDAMHTFVQRYTNTRI